MITIKGKSERGGERVRKGKSPQFAYLVMDSEHPRASRRGRERTIETDDEPLFASWLKERTKIIFKFEVHHSMLA